MAVLDIPSAASRMILARTTLKYGNVYLRTISCRCLFSSVVSTIGYGLVLGIWHLLLASKDTICQHKKSIIICDRIYEHVY